jgi:hypothetical protein
MLWLTAVVVAAAWIDNRVSLPAVLAWLTLAIAILGTVILWNLDRIREVWRAEGLPQAAERATARSR